MGLDLVIRNARIAGRESETFDIGILNGRFTAIETSLPASPNEIDAAGRQIGRAHV